MEELATVEYPKREAPWCGIGVRGMWKDYREALHDAQLDFEVEAKDAYVESEVPGIVGSIVLHEVVPDIQVNMMKDTNKILGCVSTQYGIVQNDDAFKLLDPFTQAGGIITNAGMTEQGLVFMVLRMRQKNILGDDWDFDVMCTNSFNGMFPCALVMTPIRIFCQNMYRKLMGGNDSLLHVRHGRFAQPRIEAAGKVTGSLLKYTDRFEDALKAAHDRALPVSVIEEDILGMLFPFPRKDAPREETTRERVIALREEFMDRYYDAEDNRKFHGGALGFLNAYYDYLSHRNPQKCMPGSWEDRRLSGLIRGTDIKTSVIKAALTH